MTKDSAAEAREGLLDTLAGKAKEVAGAVTGNDALVEEGHVQQAEAGRRKEAVADEAIAGAKRAEAAEEVREADLEGAREESAARVEANRQERTAEHERAREHSAAEQAAARDEAAGRAAAEERAVRAGQEQLREGQELAVEAGAAEQRAIAEQTRLEQEADAAERRAEQLRNQTEK